MFRQGVVTLAQLRAASCKQGGKRAMVALTLEGRFSFACHAQRPSLSRLPVLLQCIHVRTVSAIHLASDGGCVDQQSPFQRRLATLEIPSFHL